jgi:hypothetical protein
VANKKCTTNLLETVEGQTFCVLPTPRRIDLKSLEQVRFEMARVYRAVDRGDYDSGEGSRRVFMLAQIGKLVELSDLEKRVEKLEGTE